MRFLLLAAAAATLLAGSLRAQPDDDGLVGVTRAVTVAERQLSARAIEAELETRSGRLVYEVDLVRGETLHRATIDARSGRLLSSDKPRIENWIRSWVDLDRLRQGGRVAPLGGRLAALERQSGGQVHEVEFSLRKGRPIYTIELSTHAGTGEVRIDALTGERLEFAYDD